MTITERIKQLFGKKISGTAHKGAIPVFITDVYEGEEGWMFSYTDSHQSDGGIMGPYINQADAVAMRQKWIDKKSSNAQFVHRGVPVRSALYTGNKVAAREQWIGARAVEIVTTDKAAQPW